MGSSIFLSIDVWKCLLPLFCDYSTGSWLPWRWGNQDFDSQVYVVLSESPQRDAVTSVIKPHIFHYIYCRVAAVLSGKQLHWYDIHTNLTFWRQLWDITVNCIALLFSVCRTHHSVTVDHYMYSAAEDVRYNQKPETTLSSLAPCRCLLPLTYTPVGNHIITLHISQQFLFLLRLHYHWQLQWSEFLVCSF
jgi:hypothetical protein